LPEVIISLKKTEVSEMRPLWKGAVSFDLVVSAEPFDSADHLYEVKWDGYRGLAYLDGGTALRSRNLLDLTGRFPELAGMHKKVTGLPAILNGEIVVFENGRQSFAGLQSRGRMNDRKRTGRAAIERPAVFIAFDVLYTGGKPVMELPLLERKKLLEGMVETGGEMAVSQYILRDGRAFFDACVKNGLEGAVAKKLDSLYRPGRRSPHWQKFRHTNEADLVICGYQRSPVGDGLASLVLGGYRDGKLVYQGKVGTGFGEREAGALLDVHGGIEVPEANLAVPQEEGRWTRWVRPLLVCAVEYLAITAEGLLRHPVYKGLRRDKSPGECRSVNNSGE